MHSPHKHSQFASALIMAVALCMLTSLAQAEQTKEAFACQVKKTGKPDLVLMRVDEDASVYVDGKSYHARFEPNAKDFLGTEHSLLWQWQQLDQGDGTYRYQYAFSIDEESRTGWFFDFPKDSVKRSVSDQRFRCKRIK